MSVVQILVFGAFGACPLGGADNGIDLADVVLAPPLALTGAAAGYVKDACDATYDPHSDSVIVAVPRALLAISSTGDVSIIAGDPANPETGFHNDGAGEDASFGCIISVAAGRSGMLYALDLTQHVLAVRQVQRCGDSSYVTSIYPFEFCEGARMPHALSYNRQTDALLLGTSTFTAGRWLQRVLPVRPAMGAWPHSRVAPFTRVQSLAADDKGGVYLLDGDNVRVMAAADGRISPVATDVWRYRNADWQRISWGDDHVVMGSVAALPGGLLALWVPEEDTVKLLQLRQQAEVLGDDEAASGSSIGSGGGSRRRP
ncbi:hypothetical protein GPECTOR_145g744 [Gonium pectorale]|uniref:Uncharacterized protein n=1 Tax=Gonium pectorale TaxID=33097 RepID=A0A150FXV9_GONPE|nr:hypothetical protein GPECTOR_145g744 [Gonium pectorale]|eukprot:KXZ42453.1 hypothetical protein GPECTOR_145g744 [Gonium pectorale]